MSGWGWFCRLFSIDLRSLALFRICVAAVFLYDLVFLRFPDLDAFYVDDGMFSLENAKDWLGDSGAWSLCLLNGSANFQAGMLLLTALLSFMLLLGWQTRWITVGCWVMAVSIANRNPIVCNYGDTILQVFLFWGMFLPLGAKWSLDARRNRQTKGEIPQQHVCSAASAAALLQLSFIYFFAAIWKWNADWMGGTAAETALHLEYARRVSYLDQLIYRPLLKPLTIATLFLELLGPLVVWIPWRTQVFRYAMIVAFFLLHFSIELLFTPALLSYMCVVAWILFLPSSFWEIPWIRRVLRDPPSDTLKVPTEEPIPITGIALYRRRLANGVCLVLLFYVLLWNLATLRSQQFGFLVPQNLRWIGHVTMLGQTWDMFWRPSQHNGWHKARSRLADGSVVDALRDGEPFDAELLENNWAYFRSIRWKLFFRRLGIWKELEPIGDGVAEYLRGRWNSQHPEPQRAVELSLLYYERLGDSRGEGFSVRQTGSVTTDTEPNWETIFDPVDALMSGGLLQTDFPSRPVGEP